MLGFSFALFLGFFAIQDSNWKEQLIPESAVQRFVALDKNGHETVVHFDYDFRTGDLVDDSHKVDEAAEMVALPPGKHLWVAHPEHLKSLEDFFLDAVSELGWKLGTPKPREPITTAFKTAERDQSIERPTAERIMQKTMAGVSETRESLLRILNAPGLRALKRALSSADVVEPLKTQTSHDEFRFDAFVLKPILTYTNESEALMAAIHELASSKPRFPIEWFVESRERFSLDVRLSVLMLITHNHAAEKLIIQAVATEESLDAAWNLAMDLNSLYANERDFWIQSPISRRAIASRKIRFPSGIQFLDRRQTWDVNVSLKSRVFTPLFQFQSQTGDDLFEWLPYFQLYHYYGAFIAAIRLNQDAGVDNEQIPIIAELLGVSYKLKTMGWDTEQIQKMRELYGKGASHAVGLHSFLR